MFLAFIAWKTDYLVIDTVVLYTTQNFTEKESNKWVLLLNLINLIYFDQTCFSWYMVYLVWSIVYFGAFFNLGFISIFYLSFPLCIVSYAGESPRLIKYHANYLISTYYVYTRSWHCHIWQFTRHKIIYLLISKLCNICHVIYMSM